MKKFLLFPLLLTAINLHSQNADSVQSLINFQTAKFKYMLETAYNYHNDTIDIKNSSDQAFTMFMQSLDRESYYYDKDHYAKANQENSAQTVNIGIVAVNFEDTLTIIEVKPGSPASKAGIIPGDRILTINDVSAEKMNSQDAVKYFDGEIGGVVRLNILKYDNKIKYTEIFRDSVEFSSIGADFVIPGSDCAYIALNRFSSLTDKDFENASKEIIKQGAKCLILDLRENPGGVLSKAVAVANEFFSGGKLIAYTDSRLKDYVLKLYSKEGGLLEKTPVIVLMDRGSASGSEIVAGSIQDYDRGLVIGERSYGKGTVQKFFPMNDSTAVKLTVAEYHTPSGREIDKGKISSNYQIPTDLLMLNLDSSTLDSLQKAIISTGGKAQLPVYKSAGGRSIIGGGGIFPDYFVKPDTLTALTNVLKQRGFMLDWGLKYFYRHYKEIENNYPKFVDFYNKYNLTDEDLKDFENFSRSKNIWNDGMFVTDKAYIASYIKASIAYPLWGNNAFSAILSIKDNYIMKAIELMPKAKEMLDNNK